VRPCNQNIREALELAEKMLFLADRGDAQREDTGCGVLYGVVRDTAFKIRRLAGAEKKAHQLKGWWRDTE